MSDDDPLGTRGDFRAASLGAYLDTPYIAPIPLQVEAAGREFDRARAESPLTVGEMLAKANEVRAKFARLFGAAEHEVGFLSATSEAENIIAGALDWRAGDNVVVDDLHYTTSYVLYRALEEAKGIELRVVPSVEGRAGVEQFEPYVDGRTRLVSVSWVAHQNGYRHPLRELASLAHAHGALIYADGIQALGMFPVNLRDEGVDFVSAGAYKWLYGSFGIAAFFIREEHLERVRPDRLGAFSVKEELPDHRYRLHDGARRFEYATPAFGPLYQLEAGIDYVAKVGLDRIEAHALPLAAALHRGLSEQGFELLTPPDNASAIVAFAHGKDPALVRETFARHKLRVSFREGGRQVRAGVALFNNHRDVECLLEAAAEVRRL